MKNGARDEGNSNSIDLSASDLLISIAMSYDPDKHRRRSIRLKNFDYASPGAYFITICAYQRRCLFGEIIDGEMRLNRLGHVVRDGIVNNDDDRGGTGISGRGMAMPHPHGREFGKPFANVAPHPQKREFGKPIAGSLPTIIGSFKSAATKRINIYRNLPGTPVWQRNYYENIVRNETALRHIQRYIQTNPQKWQTDQIHPKNPSKW